MKNLFLVLFLNIVSSSCTNDDGKNAEEHDGSATFEYDIYSLILKEEFGYFDYYVISEKTSTYAPDPFAEGFYANREALEALDSSTIENFIKANDSAYTLEKKFDVAPKSVELVSKERFDEIFETGGPIDGWEAFYEGYPDSKGYLIFGSVGYNDSETEAIVEVAHIYGNLGADGLMMVLEKKNGTWKIRQAVHLWVS